MIDKFELTSQQQKDERDDQLLKALKVHGKDFQKIYDDMGSSWTIDQIQNRLYILNKKFRKSPPTPENTEILKLLSQKAVVCHKVWTEAENIKFAEALELYGDDYEKYIEHIGTNRSMKQIRLHAKWWEKSQNKQNKEELGFGCVEEEVEEDSSDE